MRMKRNFDEETTSKQQKSFRLYDTSSNHLRHFLNLFWIVFDIALRLIVFEKKTRKTCLRMTRNYAVFVPPASKASLELVSLSLVCDKIQTQTQTSDLTVGK